MGDTFVSNTIVLAQNGSEPRVPFFDPHTFGPFVTIQPLFCLTVSDWISYQKCKFRSETETESLFFDPSPHGSALCPISTIKMFCFCDLKSSDQTTMGHVMACHSLPTQSLFVGVLAVVVLDAASVFRRDFSVQIAAPDLRDSCIFGGKQRLKP
jgi:hypothetical protein